MKRFLALLLVLVLGIGLCACKKGEEDRENASENGQETEGGNGATADTYVNEKLIVYYNDSGVFLHDLTTGKSEKIADADKAEVFGGIGMSDDEKIMYAAYDEAFYYRDLTVSDATDVKIADDVQGMYINSDGTIFTYTSDEVLYQSTAGSSAKKEIADDVSDFVATADGKTILYSTNDSELYYYDGNAALIDTDMEVDYVSDDLKTVVYTKEDGLYIYTVGAGTKKIAGSVDVCYVLAPDSIYYTVNDHEYNSSLYYYNGNESSIKSDAASFNWVEEFNEKHDILCYTERVYDEQTLSTSYRLFVAVGGSITATRAEGIACLTFTESGKTIYYIDRNNDLYKLSVSNLGGEPELISSEVTQYRCYTYGENAVYFKDTDENGYGDIYVNTQFVAENADYRYNWNYTDGFFYVNSNGTLYLYNGQSIEICNIGAEADFYDFSSGEIWYMDGSYEDEKRNVYYFDGTSSKLIAENVYGANTVSLVSDIYNTDHGIYIYVPIADDDDTQTGTSTALRIEYNEETGVFDIYDEDGNLLDTVPADENGDPALDGMMQFDGQFDGQE